MIAAADYKALIAARRTLTDTADALYAAVGEARPMAASDMTRAAVLCELAETAIFGVLNTAAHHLGDEESLAALFPDKERP
jgi:hypothetical protein